MKVKATITVEIEYELDGVFPKKELFNIEKTFLEDNLLDFLKDRIEEGYNTTINANIVEA